MEPKRGPSVTGTPSGSHIPDIPVAERQGDGSAFDRLFTLLYDDFRDLAKSYLSREARAHTLQPTALVNECYLKLVDQKQVDWKNRSHVLAVGAIAMQRILVNHAIAARRQKRGGSIVRVTLHENLSCAGRDVDVLLSTKLFTISQSWTSAMQSSWNCASSAD